MRAREGFLSLALLLTQLAVSAAPADQYFGKLKVSALRIRYETLQLKKRYETHQLYPNETMHLLLLNEDAFRDWARHYSKDPWLASTGYEMATLYEELPGGDARDHAAALLVFVTSNFPNTPYARQSRDQLHRGVSVKPVPVWATQSTSIPSPASPSQPPNSAVPSPSASAAP